MAGLPRDAIRVIRNVTNPRASSIYLRCLVRTGVKPPKQDSIISLEGNLVKLQVQSPGVHDRANAAVKLLISKVLEVPKTNIYIVRGEKAHFKSISVTGYPLLTGDQSALALIKQKLLENAASSNPTPSSPLPTPESKY